MGPGPSDVHPRVLGAMGKATIGHLDPEFVGLMEEIKDLMCKARQPTSLEIKIGENRDTATVLQRGRFEILLPFPKRIVNNKPAKRGQP